MDLQITFKVFQRELLADHSSYFHPEINFSQKGIKNSLVSVSLGPYRHILLDQFTSGMHTSSDTMLTNHVSMTIFLLGENCQQLRFSK